MDKKFIENPVEAYEKLKQENEELKEAIRKDFCTHYVLGECSQEHHNNCVGMRRCIKDLEQENEELKNFHINLVGVKECEIKELVKLKQTLAEIKEIVQFADRPYKLCGEYNNCCDVLNEIWNKISEVIDEDRPR